MKIVLIIVMIVDLLLYASSDESSEKEKKERLEKQIKIEMQKEKKYSEERIFYNKDNYDFKGAEVNVDSLDSLPDIEVDDFDMDSVYD